MTSRREDGRPGGGGRLSIDRKAGSGSSWFAAAVTGTAMIAVSFGLARYGYGLLLPEMRADLGLSASAAGAISSASYAAYVVTNAAVVVVLRRWGVRTAVAAAASSAAAGMGLVAVATTPGVLAAGSVLAGAAAGFAFPPYADVVHRTMPERRRTGAWSTISSGTGWGVAVAGPLAVLLGDRWRLVWLVFVAITVVVGVCAVLTVPPGRGAADGAVARGRARSPLRRAGARPLLLSALLVGAGSSIWWSFAVDAMRAAGLGSDLARLTYAGCGIASILASFTGHLVGRTGLRRATRWSVAALAVALATFGTATGTTLAAVTTSVLFGIVYAAVIAAQGLWSATVFTDRPSLGLASTNTALAVGLVTGPVLAGILIDLHGHTTAFWVAAAVVAPAALLAPTDRDARPTHDEAPPPP